MCFDIQSMRWKFKEENICNSFCICMHWKFKDENIFNFFLHLHTGIIIMLLIIEIPVGHVPSLMVKPGLVARTDTWWLIKS